jgi:hypothetical protein
MPHQYGGAVCFITCRRKRLNEFVAGFAGFVAVNEY